MEAIEVYKKHIKKNNIEEKYIMHGSTFLNGRWEEYKAEEPEANKATENKPLELEVY